MNLDQTTEAVLSKSGLKGRHGVLLLVKYPDAKKASDEAAKEILAKVNF